MEFMYVTLDSVLYTKMKVREFVGIGININSNLECVKNSFPATIDILVYY